MIHWDRKSSKFWKSEYVIAMLPVDIFAFVESADDIVLYKRCTCTRTSLHHVSRQQKKIGFMI